MRKLLLIICILGCTREAAFAQMLPFKASREMLVHLQQSKADTHRVQLLQKLSTYYMFKPNAQAADMDSAMTMARQAENLSVTLHDPKGQANSYLLYSKVYNHEGKRDKARALVIKAITVFSKYQSLDDLGEAYFNLGSYYSLTGTEMAERIRWCELGLAAFQQSGNKLKQANGNKELGDLYQIEGNNSKALAVLHQSLTLYKSVNAGYNKLQGVYDLLGQVYCTIGDYKAGIQYGLLAVKAAEQLQDASLQLATIYNRLGVTYLDLNEPESANFYFRKSIDIAKKYNDPATINIVVSNSVNALLRLKRPREALTFLKDIVKKYPISDLDNRVEITARFVQIYSVLKQYDLAQLYCNRLVEVSKNPERLRKETQRTLYGVSILFCLATHQHKLARKFLLAHRSLALQLGALRTLASNQLWWFKLDSARGNYQGAIGHYQQFKALTDSLVNVTKSKQIAQLQIQYETEKKDKNIKLNEQNIQLLTKQGLLQQSQLLQSELVKNVTFGTVALLLIIVGLLYNRYRSKQQNSLLLEVQQKEINEKNRSLQHLLTEKEWLLKEIHHRVKNNLQIVMSLLNSQFAYLTDDAAMLAIRDSQHRVQAIALIHQKLYQSENLSAIDMSVYIRELVEYLRDFFGTGQRIRFDTQVDVAQLDISYAVPLGLILNEAITNCIKYAFPDNRTGLITIAFKHTSSGTNTLTVTDNGIGLPALLNVKIDAQDSLGMSLMRGLSDDIEGHFTIESDSGTVVTIRFVYEEPVRPESAGTTPNLPLETTTL